MKKLTYKSNIA